MTLSAVNAAVFSPHASFSASIARSAEKITVGASSKSLSAKMGLSGEEPGKGASSGIGLDEDDRDDRENIDSAITIYLLLYL